MYKNNKITAIAFGLVSFLAAASASAQSVTSTVYGPDARAYARDPVLGDPGPTAFNASKLHFRSASERARFWARSDRQAPGTENGNQPDRAGAGGY